MYTVCTQYIDIGFQGLTLIRFRLWNNSPRVPDPNFWPPNRTGPGESPPKAESKSSWDKIAHTSCFFFVGKHLHITPWMIDMQPKNFEGFFKMIFLFNWMIFRLLVDFLREYGKMTSFNLGGSKFVLCGSWRIQSESPENWVFGKSSSKVPTGKGYVSFPGG